MEIVVTIFALVIQVVTSIYTIIVLAKLFKRDSLSKSNYLFVSIISIVSIIACSAVKGLFPLSNSILAIIFMYIAFKFALKINVVKSFILALLDFISTILSELIGYFFAYILLGQTLEDIVSNYAIVLIATIIQLISIILIAKLLYWAYSKYTKLNALIDSITTKQLVIFLLLLVFCVLPQLIIFLFNKYSYYSIYFLIINCIQMVIVCCVIFIYVSKSLEKDKVESDLVTTKLHNNTMTGMIDGVKTLKHDYNNIMQSLNGYVCTKQYDKLQEHINKVLKECNIVNTLGLIDPKVFNEPAIYGIVGAKYFLITEANITMDLEIVTNVKEINFPMPELSRILGILLDNAFEATQKCKSPYVKLEMRFDNRKCADIIRVINTFDTSVNIDLENIYKKGFSSKKVKSGIGLWEVKKLISKIPNSQIYPTIEKDKFIQNIIIEKNI